MHYFVADYATGKPHEVFRSTCGGRQFSEGTLERAKQNGTWSSEEVEVRPLLNLWLKGDFDPEEDEISTQEAAALLEQWRATEWRGRP